MLPRTKMKLKSKGKKIYTSISAVFGGRKESSGQVADRGSDVITSGPPSIIVQRELSEAIETSGNTRNARNDDTRSTTTSTRRSGTPNIDRNDCEARDGNTKESSGFLNHAHHVVLTNPTMVDQYTNIVNQVVGDQEAKAKELLVKHIIQGAAHDSSARDPPPKCHPGTRIKINERIIAWFYNEKKQKLILWIYGPAGVGKSAIAQTIAEALATAKCLGASVFFSRPNGRNSSRSVFITVAYQLAVHIGDYCAFISQKLASDPDLVNKGMKEQFRTFILEPFVEKKIGAGGKKWGILLDGLDELDEQHWQREIIRLVTTFALEHRDVPLVWIISSRPEPHISNTFRTKQIVSSYWEENVPVNSDEACQDVECYLRSSFQTIREEYPQIVTASWPEEIKLAELAHAASGLFAFADTVVRFIQDPRRADPVTRLDDVLSVIESSRVDSADDQPFSHLDALYICILTSVPPKVWLATQQVLVLIKRLWGDLCCTKGLSVILGLELNKIYTAINDLYSILNISVDDAYAPLRFHHASFLDFLGDVTRSRQFYMPIGVIGQDLDECGVRIWLDFRKQFPRGRSSEYTDSWFKYALRFHSDVNVPTNVSHAFNIDLINWIHGVLWKSLHRRRELTLKESSPRHRDRFWDLLCQMDAGIVCQGWQSLSGLVPFLFDTWKMYHKRLSDAGIVHKIPLKQLPLYHLAWTGELAWAGEYVRHNPARLRRDSGEEFESDPQPDWSINEPSKCFDEYISGLKYFQRHNPTLDVLIYGPRGNRFAVFMYEYAEDDFTQRPLHAGVFTNPNFAEEQYLGYYIIPYPDDL